MPPIVRYCAVAAIAFTTALAMGGTALVASRGFEAVRVAASSLLARPAPTPEKPPERIAAPEKPPEQMPASAPPAMEAPQNTDDPTPILPARFAAVPGRSFELYYDGLVTARDPDAYRITVVSPTLLGNDERRRWSFVPTAADIGVHDLTVMVRDRGGKQLAEASTKLEIVRIPPAPAAMNILIVGASNVHQGLYPNLLWTKLNQWSNGHIRFVGTYHPEPTLSIYRKLLPDVFHEGYGGWGWQLFVNHYLPGQEALYKRTASPFVFLEDGKPVLNVGRYLDERSVRGKLDAVIFDLGINETFSADPDNPDRMDAVIASALDWADILLGAFRTAAPEAKLLVAIPAPFTRSKTIFAERYGPIGKEYTDPWRHRRVVQTLARRMIARYDGKDPAIALVPLEAIFDGIDGYFLIDPGHPNDLGAEQIANALFAALMWTQAGR